MKIQTVNDMHVMNNDLTELHYAVFLELSGVIVFNHLLFPPERLLYHITMNCERYHTDDKLLNGHINNLYLKPKKW